MVRDVYLSFESLRNQIAIGLSMEWPVFRGGPVTPAVSMGVNTDPLFRECLVRWFSVLPVAGVTHAR